MSKRPEHVKRVVLNITRPCQEFDGTWTRHNYSIHVYHVDDKLSVFERSATIFSSDAKEVIVTLRKYAGDMIDEVSMSHKSSDTANHLDLSEFDCGKFFSSVFYCDNHFDLGDAKLPKRIFDIDTGINQIVFDNSTNRVFPELHSLRAHLVYGGQYHTFPTWFPNLKFLCCYKCPTFVIPSLECCAIQHRSYVFENPLGATNLPLHLEGTVIDSAFSMQYLQVMLEKCPNLTCILYSADDANPPQLTLAQAKWLYKLIKNNKSIGWIDIPLFRDWSDVTDNNFDVAFELWMRILSKLRANRRLGLCVLTDTIGSDIARVIASYCSSGAMGPNPYADPEILEFLVLHSHANGLDKYKDFYGRYSPFNTKF